MRTVLIPKVAVIIVVVAITLLIANSQAQLSSTFYATSCPNVSAVVRGVIQDAANKDPHVGAKLITLHFHDCFVNGCDGSILLDNATGIVSEKDAKENAVSVIDFNIVDDIKTAVENVCPGVVSCADIVALGLQAGVSLAGGPSWDVLVGRRDGLIANRSGAESNLPGPLDPLDVIKTKTFNAGLSSVDLVALSGANTFGKARCTTFIDRLYDFNGTGKPDPTLDTTYMESLRESCPQSGETSNILIDQDSTTPTQFDNVYYRNLQQNRGLLFSDQVLYSETGSDTVNIVNKFADSEFEFFSHFVRSMIKMGNISPLTGTDGEVRQNCRRVNA